MLYVQQAIFSSMKIYIGSDHAGFEYKKALKKHLEDLGNEVYDKGPSELNPDDDYTDFIAPVARAVSEDKAAKGIILGGSGQGEAILANRFSNVRAAVYYGGSPDILKLSRQHNDSNILSLGARFITQEEALSAVKLWLSTPFSHEERHQRRIDKTEDTENNI